MLKNEAPSVLKCQKQNPVIGDENTIMCISDRPGTSTKQQYELFDVVTEDKFTD